MPEPILVLQGLAKSVPGGRRLFAGLDLRLAPAEFVAITGDSGVGKSTLLNLVAGLDLADRGAILLDGADLETLDEAARTRRRRDLIGFVFQAFHILPHLTLGQNVALPLVLQRLDRVKALARATALLGAVSLGGRTHDFPAALSGGELQRVAIARALIHQPKLLLADEPTGNLDPDTADRVLALLVDQVRQTGAAALLVTHSPRAAAAADRVLRLTEAGLVPA